MKFTVLVTQDNTDYMNWQMNILYKSFLDVYEDNQDFISVVTNPTKNIDFKYPYFLCQNTYENFIENDHYIVYNRSYSIREYLKSLKDEEDILFLLIEPDFIFLKKYFTENLSAQFYNYMLFTTGSEAEKVIDFYLKLYPSSIDVKKYYKPIGWPIFIKKNILNQIIDRWIELTIIFRSNPESPLYKSWICDMYGFNIALAEKNYCIDVFDKMDMPPFENYNREPSFYHYCYKIEDNITKNTLFDKKSYIPWEIIDIKNVNEHINFINKFNYYVQKNIP